MQFGFRHLPPAQPSPLSGPEPPLPELVLEPVVLLLASLLLASLVLLALVASVALVLLVDAPPTPLVAALVLLLALVPVVTALVPPVPVPTPELVFEPCAPCAPEPLVVSSL